MTIDPTTLPGIDLMWLGSAIQRRRHTTGVSRAYVVLGDIPVEVVESNTQRHARITGSET
ncbi:MAG: hypothetical protein WKG01_20400 [Kofleriaceae bacterium]